MQAHTVTGDFDFGTILFIDDPDHSDDEERAIIIGHSDENQMLFVSFAARGNRIRLISARPATRKERKIYEEKYD